jgi:aminoglycoside phosphotransferase (APT) family kinase protein
MSEAETRQRSGGAAVTLEVLDRLGDGREAETLASGEGRVLRLLKDPANWERLDRERVALVAAGAAGLPVPALLGQDTVDGRPGLILERIEGRDLLSLLARRPWRLGSVARTLGETHARVNSVAAPAQLPSVHHVLDEQLRTSPLIPDRFRAPAIERLCALPEADRLCHWDFQPANVIGASAGPVVIDWSFAARGHPAADVAKTRLTIRLGQPPSGSSVVTKRLDTLGRRAIDRHYLSAYRAVKPVDVALVEKWTPLVALARLTAGIPEERSELVALVAEAF